jgi:hypothetical protein
MGIEVNKYHSQLQVPILLSLSFLSIIFKLTSFLHCLGVRNDILSLNNITHFNTTNNIWQHPWLHLLEKHNISLIILNRGAHYTVDNTLIYEVRETIQFIRKNHPKVSIIWRNTPYGHHDYLEHFFSLPLKHNTNTTHYLVESNPTYHYQDFKHQNLLIHNMLRVEFPEVLFLDVYTPTILRKDSHLDTLHYCSIGPLSDWLNLIFNALLVVNEFIVKKSGV